MLIDYEFIAQNLLSYVTVDTISIISNHHVSSTQTKELLSITVRTSKKNRNFTGQK